MKNPLKKMVMPLAAIVFCCSSAVADNVPAPLLLPGDLGGGLSVTGLGDGTALFDFAATPTSLATLTHYDGTNTFTNVVGFGGSTLIGSLGDGTALAEYASGTYKVSSSGALISGGAGFTAGDTIVGLGGGTALLDYGTLNSTLYYYDGTNSPTVATVGNPDLLTSLGNGVALAEYGSGTFAIDSSSGNLLISGGAGFVGGDALVGLGDGTALLDYGTLNNTLYYYDGTNTPTVATGLVTRTFSPVWAMAWHWPNTAVEPLPLIPLVGTS